MAQVKQTTLRYPKKSIGYQDDYLKIQVVEYKPPGLQPKGLALPTIEDSLKATNAVLQSPLSIILPMPSNIQDSNSADWVNGTMNPIAANLTGAVSSAIQAGAKGSIMGIVDSVLKPAFGAVGVLNSKEGQTAATAAISALASRALTGQGDPNQAMSRATGVVFNQNVEMLFNNVTMRPAFIFTFNLTPRSESESMDIKQIIRSLKTYMAPQKGNPDKNGSGLFIKAPYIFKLDYMSGKNKHPFLHSFKPCALVQMSVNYTGSGNYSSYSDATPVHMQLTLQFQELTPIYAEDYYDIPMTEGVGY